MNTVQRTTRAGVPVSEIPVQPQANKKMPASLTNKPREQQALVPAVKAQLTKSGVAVDNPEQVTKALE